MKSKKMLVTIRNTNFQLTRFVGYYINIEIFDSESHIPNGIASQLDVQKNTLTHM